MVQILPVDPGRSNQNTVFKNRKKMEMDGVRHMLLTSNAVQFRWQCNIYDEVLGLMLRKAVHARDVMGNIQRLEIRICVAYDTLVRL